MKWPCGWSEETGRCLRFPCRGLPCRAYDDGADSVDVKPVAGDLPEGRGRMVSKTTGSAMTLYWCEAGPLVRYEGDTLRVSNLNPEVNTQWRMGRWELFRFGLRCVWSAIK